MADARPPYSARASVSEPRVSSRRAAAITSVDGAGSRAARVAARAARARRHGDRRLGRRARPRSEDRKLLREVLARAGRAGGLTIRSRQMLEPPAAAAALVFEKRHGLF